MFTIILTEIRNIKGYMDRYRGNEWWLQKYELRGKHFLGSSKNL